MRTLTAGSAGWVVRLVIVALALAGCSSQPTSIEVTFEEAALVTFGEMFRQYGEGADPFPDQVTGDVVELDGQPAWKLDARYAVTVDGVRRIDRWIVWISAEEGGQPIIARVEGPESLDGG